MKQEDLLPQYEQGKLKSTAGGIEDDASAACRCKSSVSFMLQMSPEFFLANRCINLASSDVDLLSLALCRSYRGCVICKKRSVDAQTLYRGNPSNLFSLNRGDGINTKQAVSKSGESGR
jgi:hypothetical protein